MGSYYGKNIHYAKSKNKAPTLRPQIKGQGKEKGEKKKEIRRSGSQIQIKSRWINRDHILLAMPIEIRKYGGNNRSKIYEYLGM